MLELVANIRPEERYAARSAFATMLALMTSHAMLETARDALFLASIPASQLPFMYVAIGAVSLLVLTGQRSLAGRASPMWLFRSSLGVGAVITASFWFLLPYAGLPAVYALYLWTNVLTTTVVIQFWSLASTRFTVTQAKRLYGFIGTGSVLGAIAGSGVAGLLVQVVEPRHLVLAAAIVQLTASFATLMDREGVGMQPSVETPGGSLLDDFLAFRDYPYPRYVAGLVLLSSVSFTLADWLFKAVVADGVPPQDLATFFAGTYFLLNALSLGVQALFVGRVVSRLGITTSVLILPDLVGLAGALVMLGGGLPAVMVLKTVDGTLKHTLHRTTSELLYVPMIDRVRVAVKRVIDIVGHRGGQLVASGVILAILGVGGGILSVSAALVVSAVLWGTVAARLRQPYLDVFRRTLGELSFDRAVEFPELDMASMETLIAKLNSSVDREVLAALEMLQLQEKVHLVPALILYHPSEEVVIRALDILAEDGERDDVLPIIARLVDNATPQVHAALVRAATAIAPDRAYLEARMGSFCSSTRATAAASLYQRGWIEEEAAALAFEAVLETDNDNPRIALSRAVRLGGQRDAPGALLDDTLEQLASDAFSVPVRAEALEAMAATGDPRFLPAITGALEHISLRSCAREALRAFKADAVRPLARILADPSVPVRVRRELPYVLSEIHATAGTVLIEQLVNEADGSVEFRLVRALERFVIRFPLVYVDLDKLEPYVDNTLWLAWRYLGWHDALQRHATADPSLDNTAHRLLLRLLHDKELHAAERAIRVLGLRHADEDFDGIWRGLSSREPKIRASSQELLEAMVPLDMRDAVVSLVSDATHAERLLLAGAKAPVVPASYEDAVDAIRGWRSASLSEIASTRLLQLTPVAEAAG